MGLVDDELLVKKYVETMIRRTFGTENEMKLGKARTSNAQKAYWKHIFSYSVWHIRDSGKAHLFLIKQAFEPWLAYAFVTQDVTKHPIQD